jgi:cell division protease FtsH
MSEDLNRIEIGQQKLELLSTHLKGMFFGIDDIIDKIIDNIKFWYIFPELQLRPTIICLWGLTGTGKTALIREIVSFLGMNQRFLEIEMNGASQYNEMIQDVLYRSYVSPIDKNILFFDEIQKFRTVDESGKTEYNNKTYSDFWEFLSDGGFRSNPTAIKKVIDFFVNTKYLTDDGKYQMFSQSDDEIDLLKPKDEIGRGLAYAIKQKLDINDTIENISHYSKEKIYKIYEKFIKNPKNLEVKVFSKSLIFIGGNIDEAYQISEDVGEIDISADWYHEYSKKINIINIKDALKKRFKPEQIARFGNTHLIYPALSSKDYYKIIESKCSQISQHIYKEKGIIVEFDKSVYDLIYDNGVFPTQGVRPLLSTITSNVLPTISKFIYVCISKGEKEFRIFRENNEIKTKFKDGEIVSHSIFPQIDSIRKKIDNDSKNIVAVHELGHALVYAILFGVCPSQICTNSVSSYSSGFILRNFMQENKNNLIDSLVVAMAGRAAEEMIFGENSASTGAMGDISKATSTASAYIMQYGFDGFCGAVTSRGEQNDGRIFDRQKTGETINLMLKDAKEKAKDLLRKNMSFYKKALSPLVKEGRLSPENFSSIAGEFGIKLKQIETGGNIVLDYSKKVDIFLNS